MNTSFSRRAFLSRSAAAGALAGSAAGFGGLGFLESLPGVSAAEASLPKGSVQFRPEIEPLVRLVEDTPRERLLEEVAAKVRGGTTYRDVLASVLLAGVRNIQPRPVGFKFHAVLVVNSAHMAAQNAPDADRWLPLFWALDQFKSSQARDVKEGDWTMAAVAEQGVPPAERARADFTAAMDRWDVDKADAAVAGLARTAGAQEVFDIFCRYGARDFRDIGHKIIYVANSWRTLQTIGWEHSEPVLRSLAYALLEHEGTNPADRDEEADRAGRRNWERVPKIRAGWAGGKPDPAATREMLDALRAADWDASSQLAVDLLNRSVAPQSIWDAVFQVGAEMLMRKPGILTLHSVTSANALHFAHQQTHDDATRRFLLLQAAAFSALFRKRADANKGAAIDTFEPADGDVTIDDVFAEVGANKMKAAQKALRYLQSGGDVQSFINAAQRLIYLKGTDSHDYKFSSAVLEDYSTLSPALRDRFLAASVHWLKGSTAKDNALIARTRAALG